MLTNSQWNLLSEFFALKGIFAVKRGVSYVIKYERNSVYIYS